MLRSCDSCLRSALVFCCRPCRWSCICRRDTDTGWWAPEGGGGIRARGADGVRAARQKAGFKFSSFSALFWVPERAQRQKLSQNAWWAEHERNFDSSEDKSPKVWLLTSNVYPIEKQFDWMDTEDWLFQDLAAAIQDKFYLCWDYSLIWT